MGLFKKKTILYEGSNQDLYQGYQQILRNNNIWFKAFATDNQLQAGCCGLNSGTLRKASYTYTIIVNDKESAIAKKLISQFEH